MAPRAIRHDVRSAAQDIEPRPRPGGPGAKTPKHQPFSYPISNTRARYRSGMRTLNVRAAAFQRHEQSTNDG